MRFEVSGSDNIPIAAWSGIRYESSVVTVLELGKYGLVMYDAEPDSCYFLKVGEERIGVECRDFANCHCFDRADYFESAYGRTVLSVMRECDDGATEIVTECEFYVVPSKIGNDNYKRMVADLQKVCQSLINDLIGKSRHGQDWNSAFRPFAFRSREEELTAIARTWTELAPRIEDISIAPISNAKLCRVMSSTGRNRSYRGVSAMMKLGIDPRNPNPGRMCPTFRIQESMNVSEHRLIKGFLQFVLLRLEQCRNGLDKDIQQIESDKRFRSRSAAPGERSLYEQEDIPRLSKLRNRSRDVEDLKGEIQKMLSADFWRGVPAELEYPEPQQFAEGICYIEIANIILRYLKNGFNTGDTYGDGFMTKKTSRMYEQWVLIQIVTALERCGLEIETWDTVIRRCVNSQFGLDFKKNTRFLAKLHGRYSVLVRYEPWILPRAMLAEHGEETLCHFGPQDSFWNPDFTIELLRRESDCFKTVYAIALDAKYSRRPSEEMRRGVLKYAKIRSVDGQHGHQVARQVWLVYPGGEAAVQGVFTDDDSIEFLPSFGPVYADSDDRVDFCEYVSGDVVVSPVVAGGNPSEGEVQAPGNTKTVDVLPPIMDFIKGSLSYFRDYISSADAGG
ncbi:MAG: hypothetical protein J6R18_04915 [Kiritimatiellae bacterium]|nr:hypothetical protein [Kiritimatiellia bacterium]